MRRSSRNRTFSRVTALALAILLFSGASLPAAAAEGAAEGGVISIGSGSELLEFAQSCSLDTWSQGKTVELTADISLEGADFSPIPIFGGVFDGNGHTISGLSISGGCPAGLFGIVQPGGEVRNLRVTGRVSPSGEADTLGGLAGINHGTIAGCSFQGTVSGGARVGGLVGVNETDGQLINCSFTGTATGEHYVGGVAGENFGALVQCVNGGAVNTTELEVEAGMAESVEQLRSTESVPAGTDMGGIAGFSAGVIQGCRNDGNVGYGGGGGVHPLHHHPRRPAAAGGRPGGLLSGRGI